VKDDVCVRAPGLGCMRLSTAPDRDEASATAVLHAALDAGIEFFDTADAYCRDETDIGHNLGFQFLETDP
jgi:aryl-alcohol dehydrogenase-like predicted oxidoreductase